MAFETVEEWKVERSFALPQRGAMALPELPAAWPFREKIVKLPSASLALLINGLFFYLLITNAFDRSFDGAPEAARSKSTEMTMIALSDLEEPAASSEFDPEKHQAATASSARESPIDLTSETQLPAEWTVGRIRVSRSDAGDEPAQSPGKAGGGGGGVYDPFAGASPKRLTDQELAGAGGPSNSPSLLERVSGYFGFGDQGGAIDGRAFEALVQSLRNRLPRAKGSVELAITLDRQGAVTGAEIKGGTASPQIKFFVRNAVIGQRLSGGGSRSADAKMDLPAIVLG